MKFNFEQRHRGDVNDFAKKHFAYVFRFIFSLLDSFNFEHICLYSVNFNKEVVEFLYMGLRI